MKVSGLLNLKSVVGKISFRSQSVFWYFVLPISFYSLFVFVSGTYYLMSLNAPVEERTEIRAAFTREKIDRYLSERINEIINLSLNSVSRDICEGKLDKNSWHTYTRNSLRTSVSFDELMLCDTLGNTLAANKIDHEGNAFPVEYEQQVHLSEEWFGASLVAGGPSGGAYVSDVNKAEYNFKYPFWGIDVACPVKNTSGKLVGVLKLRVNWDATIHSIISEKKERKEETLLIFSRQGTLLAGNKEQLRLGKNKMNKAPDFSLKDQHFSAERFHYHWEQSSGGDAFKGNGWFILTLAPRVGVGDLISDNSFLFSVVVPGILLIVIMIVAWIRWRYYFVNQLNRIIHQFRRLNEGKKITPVFSGSSEMKRIEKEFELLQEYFVSTEALMTHAMGYEKVVIPTRSGRSSVAGAVRIGRTALVDVP